MRKFSHWTPRYICNRLRTIAYHLVHPDWPWLTPEAVGLLRNWLRASDEVFEWGAGRSTIWIAPRVRSITSVESNIQWFTKLRSIVERESLQNVELKYFSPNANHNEVRAYVSFTTEAGGPFDLIIVDGLYRDHCALSAIEYLKPGGLLLIDNINWFLPSRTLSPASQRQEDGPASPLWKDFSERVKAWRQIWTSNGVWDTAIWVKPS